MEHQVTDHSFPFAVPALDANQDPDRQAMLSNLSRVI
jgi:hypothetical protein